MYSRPKNLTKGLEGDIFRIASFPNLIWKESLEKEIEQ